MTPDDPEALGQQASAQGDDRLLAWRHHFPIVANTNYQTWATRGVRGWEET